MSDDKKPPRLTDELVEAGDDQLRRPWITGPTEIVLEPVAFVRRHGLGTDAARALLDHRFAAHRLRKVWFHAHGDNAAVRAAPEPHGFREVGRPRAHSLLDARRGDWVTMARFAADRAPA